jgi:hypothetical protein
MDRMSKQIADFWSRGTRNDGGCLEWNGALNTCGYGVLRFAGRIVLAHRLAYRLTHPDWRPHQGRRPYVLHRCDNRRCFEPSHLMAGSHEENMRQMKARGRSRRSRQWKNYGEPRDILVFRSHYDCP